MTSSWTRENTPDRRRSATPASRRRHPAKLVAGSTYRAAGTHDWVLLLTR